MFVFCKMFINEFVKRWENGDVCRVVVFMTEANTGISVWCLLKCTHFWFIYLINIKATLNGCYYKFGPLFNVALMCSTESIFPSEVALLLCKIWGLSYVSFWYVCFLYFNDCILIQLCVIHKEISILHSGIAGQTQ